MRKIFSLIILLVVVLPSFSLEKKELILEKVYGGPKSEKGYGIARAINGYIVVGETLSFGEGGKDVYILKIDRKGNKIWEKTFGGSKDDYAYSIIKDKDEYLIVGGTRSFGEGNSDVLILKINEDGKILWNKTFGGKGFEEGWRITKDKYENYIIIGRTTSFGKGQYDLYLIKIDKNGNKIWEKTFGGKGSDYGYDICSTFDEKYVAVGISNSFSETQDVYVVKIDKDGNLIWEKNFGGKGFDYAYSLAYAGDGYIIVGNSNSFSDTPDLYILKINQRGEKLWEKTYGGKGYDTGFYIRHIGKQEYLIVGGSNSSGAGNSDLYVVKIDKAGNIIYEGFFGGGDLDEGWSFIKDIYYYVFIGRSESFSVANSEIYLVILKSLF